jgi:hypothetical protein
MTDTAPTRNENFNTVSDAIEKYYQAIEVGAAIKLGQGVTEAVGTHNQIIGGVLQTGQVIAGYSVSKEEGNVQLGGAVGNVGGSVLGGIGAGFVAGLITGSETGPGALVTGVIGGIVGGIVGEDAVESAVREVVYGTPYSPRTEFINVKVNPRQVGYTQIPNPSFDKTDSNKYSGPQIGGTNPVDMIKTVVNSPNYKPVTGPDPFENRGGPTGYNSTPPTKAALIMAPAFPHICNLSPKAAP